MSLIAVNLLLTAGSKFFVDITYMISIKVQSTVF